MSNIFAKTVGGFKSNYINTYINKYIKSAKFYNFGWGNLEPKMIKNNSPKLVLNKGNIGIYGNPQGYNELITEVCKFIENKSKIKIKKENIIITNGATNSIFLLSYFFKNIYKIDKVLMQNPTYDTAINIFRSQGFRIKTANPLLTSLDKVYTKLSYVMFRLHNPTGLSVSKTEKNKIIKTLTKNGYLIEDDAYGLFDAQEIDISKNKKYIYIGSFSKYIFPGIRLGYIIANKNIISKLILIQKYYNSHPNILSQLTLLNYIKSGIIEEEIDHKVRLINQKRKLFEKFLSPKIKEFIIPSTAGFYYWVQLPKNIKSYKIFIFLLKRGVFVIPGDIYFLNNQYNAIRISISSVDKNKIRKGVDIINEVFKKYE